LPEHKQTYNKKTKNAKKDKAKNWCPQKKTQKILSKNMKSTMKKKSKKHDKLQNKNHHNVDELEQLSYTKALPNWKF